MELQNEIVLVLGKCKSGVSFGFLEMVQFVRTQHFCKAASEITVTSEGSLLSLEFMEIGQKMKIR